MKLLQAIITSSVETLDGRQGIGLVACSRLMPESIKKQAAEWESSSSENREPVYSYKLLPDAGSLWAVMNRTIPITDYTGRRTEVSHTVAISIDELRDWFRLCLGEIITPCEFMLNFPWKNSWNETPHWIEETVDVNSFEMLATRSEAFYPFDWHPATALLAFQIDGIETPKPKRLAWKSGNLPTVDMLLLFHTAWLSLDPWRGQRNYGDHLGESPASLMASWECNWTTNLRHERPDDYQWVILAPGTSNLGNREVIDVTEWKDIDEDAIARMIGASGRILVARAKDPENWAQGEVCKLLENLKLDRDNIMQAYCGEFKNTADAILEEAGDIFTTSEEKGIQWEPHIRKIDTDGIYKYQIDIINNWKSRYLAVINDFQSLVDDYKEKYVTNFIALQKLYKYECGEPYFWNDESYLNYSDLDGFKNTFKSMEEKLRPTLLYSAVSKIAYDLDVKYREIIVKNISLSNDAGKNEKIIKALKQNLLNANNNSRKTTQWLWITIFSLLAIAICLGVLWQQADTTNTEFNNKANSPRMNEPLKN